MTAGVRAQTFVVEVVASVMPPLGEADVHDAVLLKGFEKEREHGMGALAVTVHEVDADQVAEVWGWVAS